MMKGTIVPVITVFFLSRHGRPLGLEKKQSWVASAFPFFMFFPLPCHSACFLPGFFFFKELYIPYGNSVNAAVAVNYAISFPRICLEPEKGLG
ncbi:hypothetical protein ABFY27_06975 [Akkermansia massiliensis]